jgi:hypothetical protein
LLEHKDLTVIRYVGHLAWFNGHRVSTAQADVHAACVQVAVKRTFSDAVELGHERISLAEVQRFGLDELVDVIRLVLTHFRLER